MICVTAGSILYASLAIVGILLLTFVAVRPEHVRQEKADRKFKRRKIEEYKTEKAAQIGQEYREFVARGYPNTREQDRGLLTEDRFANLRATAEAENLTLSGKLLYPRIRGTDVRYIVIGAILSSAVVLAQSLFPAC
jgi:hypothetical protein